MRNGWAIPMNLNLELVYLLNSTYIEDIFTGVRDTYICKNGEYKLPIISINRSHLKYMYSILCTINLAIFMFHIFCAQRTS